MAIMKMAKCDGEVGVKRIAQSPSYERPPIKLRLLRRSISLDAAKSERMDILWEEDDDRNMEMISPYGRLCCRHVLKNSWVKALRRTGSQKSKSFARIFNAFKTVVLAEQFRSRKMRAQES